MPRTNEDAEGRQIHFYKDRRRKDKIMWFFSDFLFLSLTTILHFVFFYFLLFFSLFKTSSFFVAVDGRYFMINNLIVIFFLSSLSYCFWCRIWLLFSLFASTSLSYLITE